MQKQLKGHRREEDIEEKAHGFDSMDRLEIEQLMTTIRENRQSALTDEGRRFFVSIPLTGIRGMGSQYHPGVGPSQLTFEKSGTYRKPIEIEIKMARYEKKKTIERWRSAGPKEYRKESKKKKNQGYVQEKRGRNSRARVCQ